MKFLEPLYDQLSTMWVGFVQMLPMLGIGLFVLFATWIASKIVVKVLSTSLDHSPMRSSLKDLFGTLAKVAVWTVGVLITVTIIFPSLTPAKLLATLGLGSVAIGFAFKDVFENFLAGILIMLREPMRIGDFIECEGVDGKVELITIRDTYVRKTDGQLVLVPNAHLFQNPLRIMTDKKYRRFDITAGVGYGEDVDKCREIIRKAVEGLDGVVADKPIDVFACEFGDSSINYKVRWWAESTPRDGHETRDRAVSAIKSALDSEGVEIPFPYRTMTFAEPLVIEQTAANSDDDASAQSEEKQQTA